MKWIRIYRTQSFMLLSYKSNKETVNVECEFRNSVE